MATDLLNLSSGVSGVTGDPPPPGLVGFDISQLGTNDPMSLFLKSVPGYQFGFNEGLRGVQANQAAAGTLLTGGALKKAARFGGGFSDQHYGDTVNRYLSLADLGLRGATAPFI